MLEEAATRRGGRRPGSEDLPRFLSPGRLARQQGGGSGTPTGATERRSSGPTARTGGGGPPSHARTHAGTRPVPGPFLRDTHRRSECRFFFRGLAFGFLPCSVLIRFCPTIWLIVRVRLRPPPPTARALLAAGTHGEPGPGPAPAPRVALERPEALTGPRGRHTARFGKRSPPTPPPPGAVEAGAVEGEGWPWCRGGRAACTPSTAQLRPGFLGGEGGWPRADTPRRRREAKRRGDRPA